MVDEIPIKDTRGGGGPAASHIEYLSAGRGGRERRRGLGWQPPPLFSGGRHAQEGVLQRSLEVVEAKPGRVERAPHLLPRVDADGRPHAVHETPRDRGRLVNVAVKTEQRMAPLQESPGLPRSDVNAARDLVEGGSIRRAVEDTDHRSPLRWKRTLQRLEVRGQRLLPLAAFEGEGAEPSLGLAPESFHARGGRKPLFPAIPVLHSERRDRDRGEPGDPRPVEKLDRAAVDVAEPADPRLFDDFEGGLPVVVPGDVVEIGGARLAPGLPN